MIFFKKFLTGLTLLLNAVILEGCTFVYSDGNGNAGVVHANEDDILDYVIIAVVILAFASILTMVIVALLAKGGYIKKKDNNRNGE